MLEVLIQLLTVGGADCWQCRLLGVLVVGSADKGVDCWKC